jgi:hypothetical protein
MIVLEWLRDSTRVRIFGIAGVPSTLAPSSFRMIFNVMYTYVDAHHPNHTLWCDINNCPDLNFECCDCTHQQQRLSKERNLLCVLQL